MSKAHLGHKGYWAGKTKSEEIKNKIRGENNVNWKSDRSQLHKSEDRRKDYAYMDWRKRIKARDKYRCRIADKNCKGILEAHHILGWTLYPELRYEINNGITLCHYHHPRGKVKEKEFSLYFQGLILKN